jgi:hypothetical protein
VRREPRRWGNFDDSMGHLFTNVPFLLAAIAGAGAKERAGYT